LPLSARSFVENRLVFDAVGAHAFCAAKNKEFSVGIVDIIKAVRTGVPKTTKPEMRVVYALEPLRQSIFRVFVTNG